jgi:hypothetical protein
MPLTLPSANEAGGGIFSKIIRGLQPKESYTNPTLARPDKQKVWCKQCFTRRIAGGKAHDEKEVAAGQRGSISIRDENTIKHTCVFFSLVNAL